MTIEELIKEQIEQLDIKSMVQYEIKKLISDDVKREITKVTKEEIQRIIKTEIEEYKANAKLIASAPKLLAALIEISEGKGRYNEDKLIHASNTIEDMIQLAKEAINEAVS